MINVKYFLIVCTLSIFSNLFAEGSHLDYNSNHRPDSGSDAEGSGKRGWVVFFVLILLIMASLGLAWKKQWLTLPIKQ